MMSRVLRALARSTSGLQRRLVYLPGPPVPSIDAVLPEGDEVAYTTDDGLDGRAWFLPPTADSADAPTGPAPGVLLLHGNGGNRADRIPLGRALAQLGLGVLLVDYRGYGGNPGTPDEDGLHRDAVAALAALRARDEVDAGRIVYVGESLGAAVAVRLATKEEPDALVLRSPFTSLPDAARVHYPFVSDGLLLDRYPTVERIGEVRAPVFVAAGDADSIVPVEQSRRVHDAASPPRELHVVRGADHNDLELFVGDELIAAIADFLTEHGPLDRSG